MKYYTLESGSSQATMFSNSSAAMAPVTAPLQAPSRKPAPLVWPLIAPAIIPTMDPPVPKIKYYL